MILCLLACSCFIHVSRNSFVPLLHRVDEEVLYRCDRANRIRDNAINIKDRAAANNAAKKKKVESKKRATEGVKLTNPPKSTFSQHLYIVYHDFFHNQAGCLICLKQFSDCSSMCVK
jgi:hypothetical protein